MIEHKGIDRPRPEVANRVVAWHNRHPLACRIKPAQVRHVGLIVLPFAAATGSALAPSPAATEAALESRPGDAAPDSDVPVEIIPPSLTDAAPDDGVDIDLDGATDEAASPAAAAADLSDAPTLPIPREAPATEPAAPSPLEDLRADDDTARQRHAAPAGKPLRWWRRIGRRSVPQGSPALFSEVLIPSLGARGLADLARKHGLLQRPPGDQWPERVAQVDRDLQDAADAAGLCGRADRVLLTATIDDGTRRLRVVIGGGLRPDIVGPRLWDRQRLGLAGALLAGSVVASSWSLGYRLGAADTPSGPATQMASAASGVQASAASSPASGPASGPTVTLVGVPASAQASATVGSRDAALASAQAAPPPPAAGSGVPPEATPRAAPLAAATPAAEARPGALPSAASAKAADRQEAEGSAQVAEATPAHPTLPAASGNDAGPVPASIGAVAHKSIVPDLRPQLATSVQTAARQQFALVSAPLRSRSEADTMLRRLRTETSRLHHPVAVETSALSSPQGWRVSWWPFAGRKQAENARAMLADKHLDMDIVDF
jgi:hypothetical protein